MFAIVRGKRNLESKFFNKEFVCMPNKNILDLSIIQKLKNSKNLQELNKNFH